MSFSYTQTQLLTNIFRACTLTFGGTVFLNCVLLYSSRGMRYAAYPLASSVCLVMVNLIACIYDILVVSSCTGRSLTLYVFSYASQLSLDVYQTNKMIKLSFGKRINKYVSIGLFVCRFVSLIVNLCYYYDIKNPSGICSTGFPIFNLFVEKAVVILFDLGNMANLYVIMRSSEKHGVKSSFMSQFFLRDGLTFGISLVLNIMFVSATAAFPSGWAYSMTAALGNGIGCLVLFVQVSLSYARRVIATRETGTTSVGRASQAKREIREDK